MQAILQQWQTALGVTGFAAAFGGGGFVLGLILGFVLRRWPAAVSPPASSAAPPTPAEILADTEAREKRRNPRRPGRSVEVFVCQPGSTGEPPKGVVLDRSVGGLKLLVGDDYPINSTIGVLPATASNLTPWVEVEVKTCRRSGDDWEIGVQFLKLPPYATMVLFG